MKKKIVIPIVIFLFITPLITIPCSAQDYASDYAPILYFEAEETCYPVNISFHITNSYLYEVGSEILIDTQPSPVSLSSYTDYSNINKYYLDNQLGSPDDLDGIINNYKNQESTIGYSVYYRIYYGDNSIVVQYWMFYPFKKGEINQHEGDWEMVQVVIQNGNPSWVAYSQHHFGQRANWDQVEKEGNHIKIYVARDSHANYIRSYSGVLGMARDFVGSNGKVLNPNDYTLVSLETNYSQGLLNFIGRWGECDGEDIIKFISSDALGRCGPLGPKYLEDGRMWDNPISWGNSLPQANNILFTVEWFFYNFLLIFIIILVVSLSLTGFFIYQRHKKYGLGPRIVSLIYIDGINLKSIGNILCIVGIILAIFGLFYPWYMVSYNLSSIGSMIGIEASGMQDLIKIDGFNGVQFTIPSKSGLMPLGTIAIPFSLIIGIGIAFLIISTIGINHSKKLGWKYIWRGIRIILPIILILIVIMAIGSIVPSEAAGSDNAATATFTEIINSISSSPFGNQQTFYISYEGIPIPLPMQWGLGLGALLLLFAGIIIITSGILEFIANTQLFTPKILPYKKFPSIISMQPETDVHEQTQQTDSLKKDVTKSSFCTKCGHKIIDNSAFCTRCGKKVEK